MSRLCLGCRRVFADTCDCGAEPRCSVAWSFDDGEAYETAGFACEDSGRRHNFPAQARARVIDRAILRALKAGELVDECGYCEASTAQQRTGFSEYYYLEPLAWECRPCAERRAVDGPSE